LVADIEGGFRPKVFEDRVLRRIYGPKKNDVTVEWIKLHDEDLTKYW